MKTKNTYSLPLKESDLAVAHSDSRVHKIGSRLEYAVDFPLNIGTPIVASCDGIVKVVYMESAEGGIDDKFRNNINKYTNRIRIEHSPNEYSEYAHLEYQSAQVKVGDTVKRGDVIALSGNTGLSTRPHLHFHVMQIIEKDGVRDWETLEVQWERPFEILRR